MHGCTTWPHNPPACGCTGPAAGQVTVNKETTREALIRAGLNPEPTCWSDSGISPAECAAMRRVAEQYPDGAYALFVQLMDQGEAARKKA
jgi:hypothetical protein